MITLPSFGDLVSYQESPAPQSIEDNHMARKVRLTESERAEAVATLDLALGDGTPSEFAQEIRAKVAAGEMMLAHAVEQIRNEHIRVFTKEENPFAPSYVFSVWAHKGRYKLEAEVYTSYSELINGQWVLSGDREHEWMPIFEFSTRTELATYLWSEFGDVGAAEVLARCQEIGIPA